MNSRGKEQIVKRIVKEILNMWREKKSDPIIMKGKDEQALEEEGTHIPPTNGPLKIGGKRNGQPKNISLLWKESENYNANLQANKCPAMNDSVKTTTE